MLDTGLGTSVFAGGYTRQASNGTATWASPQGPQTAVQAGFGTSVGGGAVSRITTGVLSIGSLSLAALIFIYLSLPR